MKVQSVGSFIVRMVIAMVLIGVIGLVLLPLFVSVAFAGCGTPTGLPNLFNMTLGDFIWWIVSEAVLGAGIAYALAQLNVPDRYRGVIVAGALGAAAWIVRQLLPFIPPEYLSKTVWEFLFVLFGMIPGWIGLKAGALAYVAQMRAAKAPEEKMQSAIRLAGL